MLEQKPLAPIELTDAELAAVSGGVAVGIAQTASQNATLAQVGGNLSIGGGNGATGLLSMASGTPYIPNVFYDATRGIVESQFENP
jgi:bacteriocin-like protein